MDFSNLLYGPIYQLFGVDILIRGVYFDTFSVRAIDMTSGVEVGNEVGVKSIVPAAVIHNRELTENGLAREDLEGANVEMNSRFWRVKATMPKPSPTGERDGELYLFLEEDE